MLRILTGAEATALIASPAFQAGWIALHRACPWATVFQDVPFVLAWYTSYADTFDPVVVCDATGDAAVDGLLFLAVERATGALVPCGTSQAEYDVWLARPARGIAFIEEAWTALGRDFPQRRLEFLFLPPGTPMSFSDRWQARCFVRRYERPLLDTTPTNDSVQASLKKKGNKSKLNQLQRLGGFSFQRVDDPDEFDALLNELIPLFDSRQLGLSGTAPFHADPQRRPFFREMLRRKILHVTAMRVGGRLAAAHLGQINGREVLLGMIVHSPFFAKYSVGKFQLLLLGETLQREGVHAFDLTPSGDYKERFATHHDEAHILTVCLSDSSARTYRVRRRAIEFGKRFISSERVKDAIALAGHRLRLLRPAAVPGVIWRALIRAVVVRREFRVYVINAATAASGPPSIALRRDALDDLLRYAPAEAAEPPPAAFMRAALARLSSGDHLYTRVEQGRLVQWGWLSDPAASASLDADGESLTLPAYSAVLADFHTTLDYRGRGQEAAALAFCVAEAGRAPAVQHVVATVFSDQPTQRATIEAAGFELWRRIVRLRVLWWTRRSTTEAGRQFPMPPAESPDGPRT